MNLKKCSKCKIEKPLTDFFNSSRYKDGKYCSCKECQKNTTILSIIKKWGTLNNYYSEYRNRLIGGNPSIIYTKKKSISKSHGIEFDI